MLPDGSVFIRPPRAVLNQATETLEQLYEIYQSIGFKRFVRQYLQYPSAVQYINYPMYYEFDTTDWTPEKGKPEMRMIFSNAWYVIYDCFGLCKKPPYLSRDPLTPEQREQNLEYSQQDLLRQTAEDTADM